MDDVSFAYEKFYAALKHVGERQGRGFQTNLAKQIGVSLGFINQVFKGEFKRAGFETQVKIASALGYDYLEFLEFGSRLITAQRQKHQHQQNSYSYASGNFFSDVRSRGAFKSQKDAGTCLFIPIYEHDDLYNSPTSRVVVAASELEGRAGHLFRGVRVVDSCMWPLIPAESVIIVDEDDRIFVDGKIYALRSPTDGKLIIRRLWEKKLEDSKGIALMCANPECLPDLTTESFSRLVIGKVILLLRNFENE